MIAGVPIENTAFCQAKVVILVGLLGFIVNVSAHQHSNSIKWVDSTQVAISDLEPVGGEILDPIGTHLTMYLARVVYRDTYHGVTQTGLIPGKYNLDLNGSYKHMEYGLNGDVYRSTDFEVLTYPKGAASWIPGGKVSASDEKVIGGIDPLTSELLHICRFVHIGKNESVPLLITGKLTNNGDCIVPYYKEVSSNVGHETLVVNAYGKYIGE